jgi:hypothetical protein
VLRNDPLPALAAVAPPVIVSFTPAAAPNGADITVNGTNFSGSASSDILYMGAAKGKIISATPSQLTVQVPPGSTYSPISVVNTTTGLQASAVNPLINTFKSVGVLDTSVFKVATSLSSGYGPEATAIGDLDGDGKPDVVSVNNAGYAFTILVAPNSSAAPGSFTFNNTITYSVTSDPGEIGLYDLDGDGKLDILFLSLAPNGKPGFGVLLNTSTPGNISFAPPMYFAAGIGSYIAAGDLDGDGKIDVIVGSSAAAVNESSSIEVFRNVSIPGKLSFTSPVMFGTNGGGMIKVADIDNDGHPDIIIANANSTTVSVLRNTSQIGGVAFEIADFITGTNPLVLRVADIDGDGKPDIITTNVSGSKDVSILLNTSTAGNVSFAADVDLTDADQLPG